jgi:replicative DNA helicase
MVRAMSALAAVEQPQIANVEAEAALLGAMMQTRVVIDQAADRVRAEHFVEAVHGRIFTAILKLHSEGKTANPITLKPFFDDDPEMKQLGGPSYLVTIMSASGVEVIGARDFADQIRELAMRRQLFGDLRNLVAQCHDHEVSLPELLASAERVFADAEGTERREATAADAILTMLQGIEAGLPPGVTSNIEGLDKAIGPIRSSDLAILAGRPGMGKTLAALSYAKGAAEQGFGVLFVSLEMSEEQLAMRLAADLCFDGHSGINFQHIEQGNLSSEQFRRLYRAQDQISDLPLVIVDLPSIRVAQLNALVRRHKRRFAAKGQKLALVVLDYLQLIDAEGENRTAEITKISRGLKSCAKANDVGLLALAQLSRKVEEREEKRPRLADLRESGSIEQDADAVLFLYRHEYYLLQTEPPEGSDKRERWESALRACQGDIEFICAKRRQGQTGIRHGRFHGAFQAVR